MAGRGTFIRRRSLIHQYTKCFGIRKRTDAVVLFLQLQDRKRMNELNPGLTFLTFLEHVSPLEARRLRPAFFWCPGTVVRVVVVVVVVVYVGVHRAQRVLAVPLRGVQPGDRRGANEGAMALWHVQHVSTEASTWST